ncbi:transglycosylase SLT domain-containing protein [Klebsiella aerogenes]
MNTYEMSRRINSGQTSPYPLNENVANNIDYLSGDLSGITSPNWNEVHYGTPYPGHSVWADGLPLSPAQIVDTAVAKTRADQVKQTVSATPVINMEPKTQPVPSMEHYQVMEEAHNSRINSGEVWNIEPPADHDITKGMWLGSALATLFVGTTTGNWGQAAAVGGLAALNIHDQGYARQERDRECQKLLDQGYSYDAVYQWYTSGQNKALMDDRKRMEQAREFNIGNAEKAREFNMSNRLANSQLSETTRHNQAMESNSEMSNRINMLKAGYDEVIGEGRGLGSAISFVESKDNVNAVNPSSGARGAVQVLPSTAASPGYGMQPFNYNWDLNTQRQWAEQYISNMAKAHGFTTRQAVAAYNAGPAAIKADIAKYGNDWENHITEFSPNADPMFAEKVSNAMKATTQLVDNGTTSFDPTSIQGSRVNNAVNGLLRGNASSMKALQTKMNFLNNAVPQIEAMERAMDNGDDKLAGELYANIADELKKAIQGGNKSLSESDKRDIYKVGDMVDQMYGKYNKAWFGGAPNETVRNTIANAVKANINADQLTAGTMIGKELRAADNMFAGNDRARRYAQDQILSQTGGTGLTYERDGAGNVTLIAEDGTPVVTISDNGSITMATKENASSKAPESSNGVQFYH